MISSSPAPDGTALRFVELAPGATFRDRDHSGTERAGVLPGDFYEAAAGTRHERIASPSGCTGLQWGGAQAWRRWQSLSVAR